MLFNSYEFLLGFLPVVLAGFFLAARVRRSLAAGWVALASLFFYAWWSWAALPLLVGSIVFNYALGRLIVATSDERRRSALLAIAVTLNLATLAVFKYADFFLETANSATGGALAGIEPLHIVLPIGISFYTFTQIAFLVDCRQGKVRETRFVHYLLFVTWFPHLISGPLLHHAQLMPQVARDSTYRPHARSLAAGLSLFTIGLAKKVFLADPNGLAADRLFDAVGAPNFVSACHGTLSYAFQIYFDFSGYTDMAIGISLLFGIRLPVNFDSPYRATSIVEFWRRWHISLSTFLRDYLYVPLGGNRLGTARRHANLLVTMLLGGLWHGAAATFVVWGALHGLYLVAAHGWRAVRGPSPSPPSLAGSLAGWGLTFVAVCVAWVFFRAASLTEAFQVLRGIAGGNGVGLHDARVLDWSSLIVAFAIALSPWNSNRVAARIEGWRTGGWSATAVGACVGILLVIAALRIAAPGSPNFLYFQF